MLTMAETQENVARTPLMLQPKAERIAVIIPCYKVSNHILEVITAIGPEVDAIYVVDDCCPEESGKLVQSVCRDPRIKVLFNTRNLGVGGAVKHGYAEAVKDGFTFLVKVDGDGQANPSNISRLIAPIKDGLADYVKANRFFSPRALRQMPAIRIVGNGLLSFLTKLSSGYWHIMDPTNGFTAIHAKAYRALEPERIDNRFFFETDMLCRLHLVGAVVQDISLPARYGDEVSNLKIHKELFTFLKMHCKRLFTRIVYDYFVRDFNVASAQLVFGTTAFTFGMLFGAYNWIRGIVDNTPSETGTIVLAILPTILGFQMLLSALNYDISNRNTIPLHKSL